VADGTMELRVVCERVVAARRAVAGLANGILDVIDASIEATLEWRGW
jgi:hypothetical protein